MRSKPIFAGTAVLLLALASFLLLGDGMLTDAPLPTEPTVDGRGSDAATGDLGGAAQGEVMPAAKRTEAAGTTGRASGVRGVVLDAATGAPLAGIEVLALKQQPSFEPLMNRFRGLIQGGLFTDTHRPAHVLGRTTSAGDGSFELTGVGEGLVFLDGRSDGYYVRTPASARLAGGQMVDGVELRAHRGGRVRGIVLGPDGAPVAGAAVSLRPGLNAFLGQLTDRNYRWLEAVTDVDGRFDLPGVPAGNGYVVSSSASTMAVEEVHGVDVRTGQVTDVTVRGHDGATVRGRVLSPLGEPLAKANVAMVYLDISRVLFSADGRSEPITTDENGAFVVRPVAAGRVAFVAVADGLAPSPIEELAVVDGGTYDDLELRLDDGRTVKGRVVDDEQKPVAGAVVELRPWERPDDPQFLKMMLKIRRVEVTSGADGTFTALGLTGERLVATASKPGYTTATRMGVKITEPEVVIEIQRGAVVRGRVVDGDGKPIARFRVDTRSQPVQPAGEVVAKEAGANGGRSRATEDGMSGPSWEGGRGRRGEMQERTIQLPEGQTMAERGMSMEGNWREIADEAGRFELRGIPPGDIRVRVRAEGCLDPEDQHVVLAAGQVGDELTFSLEPGLSASGIVVDAATGKPVPEAQVTAYKQREQKDRRMFQFDIDPEDMDFLGLSSTQGRRSVMTDGQGRFAIEALATGTYRFTARHPDMAKSSAKDVVVAEGQPVPPIEIALDGGGAIEGAVTGLMQRPLADAVIAAFSMQSGTLRSASTDKQGNYRIDGLSPGQYVVFKSRMDERADNIPLELMSNMRLKTVAVRQGKTSRLDIQDESENGVRVHGVVREKGVPVPRALVTVLGADRDGFLGMGVRADAADLAGRYELLGVAPGSYVVQISRFQGRPVQTSMTIEVPEDQFDYVLDLDLPSSSVRGRVVDSRGQPVANVQVSLGSDSSGVGGAEGLIGMIAQGGLSQGRTDDNGEFEMRSVSAGTYRLRAGQRNGPGRGRRSRDDEQKHGEAELVGVVVDGATDVDGLMVTLPLAGRITGIVVDGSGAPVRNAEIHYAETSRPRRKEGSMLASLFGMQAAPILTGDDGRFVVEGLNPGVYDLRVDTDALEAGRLQDVQLGEDATVDVQLRIVRGAKIRVRATNVDKSSIPLAWVSLYDGNDKPVVRRISTLAVMKRLMTSKDEVADSGWYEFGSVPPDTYTLVIAEPNQPELRVTRTVADGDTLEWDVDVAAELATREAQKAK